MNEDIKNLDFFKYGRTYQIFLKSKFRYCGEFKSRDLFLIEIFDFKSKSNILISLQDVSSVREILK